MSNLIEELHNFTLYDPSLALSISLGIENFIYEQIEGLALPPIERHLEITPLQHGASDFGFHLSPRQLKVQLTMRAQTSAEYYQRRSSLIQVLRPYHTLIPSILECRLPEGTAWRMQVFCTSLSFSAKPKSKDINSPSPFLQTAHFTLVAPNPVWTQYTTQTITTFYQNDIPSTKDIVYNGTWLAYPYPFSLRGPITHPIITNLSGGMKLDLNTTIAQNQTVFIDLRPGYKTIMKGSESLLPALSADSDLESFAFLPAPEALGGINSIKVEGANCGETTRVAIAFTPTRIAL